MEKDSLFNNIVTKTEAAPRWKLPVEASKIQASQAVGSDFRIQVDTAEKAEKAEKTEKAETREPRPTKPRVLKPTTTADIGFAALPTQSAVKAPVKETKKKTLGKELENTAEAVGSVTDELQALGLRAQQANLANTIERKAAYFVPSNRKLFKEFIQMAYQPYKLLPLPPLPDPDACAKSVAESKTRLKMFEYQKFVRDYIQYASPYRGILVYHGLGSGKTCASIAAMEALYQKGQKPVYVFTPASLEENYRGDISKCGPFLFRTNNHWFWLPIPQKKKTPESELALKLLKIPLHIVDKQKGVWIPDPSKRIGKDFEELSPLDQQNVRKQIRAHMDSRIEFKHYNGLSIKTLKAWACAHSTMFDGATIVIDEVHNLSRLINNAGLEDFYKTEPADLAQYIPKYCEKGKQYRIAYLLYRILCNAVGCKIVALSATPIINFPQELGILANLLAGNTRIVEITVDGASELASNKILSILNNHDEVDFAEVVPQKGSSIVRFTPVPSGCTKIFDPATHSFRGFLRKGLEAGLTKEMNREQNLPEWFARVNAKLEENGIRSTPPKFRSVQRLPDIRDDFNDMFINQVDLKVKDETRNILLERLSGLISYYKGGKADLMATVRIDEVVYVDMSNKQLEQYTEKRNEEIKRERKPKKAGQVKPGVVFDDVLKNQNSTFKIFSRAVCNFAFPEGMVRPYPSDFEAYKMTGEKETKEEEIVVEAADADALVAEGKEDKEGKVAEPPSTYDLAIAEVLATFHSPEAKHLFSKENLPNMSPKFQAILDRLQASAGPILIYSNFLKLEGVGLLAISLEAQLGYQKLDIMKTADGWKITPESLRNAGRPVQRYITYTGGEDKEKRSTLLKIYNGNWSKLPRSLVDQIFEMSGNNTNLHGEIVKVIMITQTGAEGISLANVRQVHILEPHWNYVRLDQVKGRAVRICSHMELPPEERMVDIYTYIAKFAMHQEIDETLKNFDGGITTDQQLLNLLNAKKQLAESVMDTMKASAVDCELMETENGGVACYKLPGKPDMSFTYHPDMVEHMKESAGKVMIVRK